ncbi:Nif11-like leader peptide family natural product precursor [Synechococcus sp. BIOS-E4-1]|uniref:Nif11-like leader peptide family natural product precursor n=1 Tax=Synechococcus sp. BIOS-E4-1 TaxID=1400864 RepID=UPI00164544D4|nr:Nif11-like leader peptide family natural product precursor [Synechococcus sp. BIOS-E4-1]
MSVQEDLLNLIATNSEFKQSITSATTAEEAVKLAADHGIQISVEDLTTAFKSRMSELSEEELEAVAGGKNDGCGKGTPAAAGTQYNWLELL